MFGFGGPSKAQWREQAQKVAEDYQRLEAEAQYRERQLLNKLEETTEALNTASYNLSQLSREKTGNLPPPVITIGVPQGHDPRDDLPTDVVKLQKALDAAKRNFATKCVQYDELDNEAAKTFEQMGTKLATAMQLLTPAKKREYARRLTIMGWGDPINYEKDTL